MAKQTTQVSLPNQWTARPYQKSMFNAILVDKKKRACLVWHRRAGKDSCAMNLLAVLSQMRVGLYWHCLPSFQQGRRVVWNGIMKDGRKMLAQAFPSEIVESINETDMSIKLKNGSIYQVVGSDNYDALVGSNPIATVFSEYSVSDPKAWDYIRPILAENEGIAVFIYTARRKNHGYKLYQSVKNNPAWFTELLTIYDTGAIPESVMQEERDAGMPEDLIRQEFLCDWTAAIVGSFYSDLLTKLEDRGGIVDFEYEYEDVNTHWDLGISDNTAIWFWNVDSYGEPQVIDCYQAHGLPISHYVDVIKARPYRYVRHWLPHDAQARSLATGISIMEQMKDLGMPVAISPKMSIMDGIQAVRALLLSNIKIHKTNCKDGIEALDNYKREYNEETKEFGSKPLHDWSSHFSDAFRYFALSIRAAMTMNKNFTNQRIATKTKSERPAIVLPTLDEMWKFKEESIRIGSRERI